MSKRITIKRSRPNPLFQDWLEELHDEAKIKNSKLEPMLKEALSSLSKFPLPLQSGSECAILKGFDKRLCSFLDKRLDVYHNRENNSRNVNSIPEILISNESNTQPSTDPQDVDNELSCSPCNEHQDDTSPPSFSKSVECYNTNLHNGDTCPKGQNSTGNVAVIPRNKRSKTYKPAFRSGGYAILVTLFEYAKQNGDNPSLNKEMLVEKAQRHSEESFTRPKPESFYTAWSVMSKLISKGLVAKNRGKKVQYCLTAEGMTLAEKLIKEAEDTPTVNDIIFKPTANLNSSESNINSDVSMASLPNGNIVEMTPGSFDIILLIDKNETSGVSKKNDPTVAQFNKYPDLNHEYRSLKVGDFTWIAKLKTDNVELVLPFIVERKRMDDFGASIKDGRFHEQKYRLRKCGIKNVVYLVENYGTNKHVGLPYQSLMQAIANTRVQDGFKVHITESLTHSTRFLAMMTKRLMFEYKDKKLIGRNAETSGDELMTFNYFNESSVKNKTLTVTETFIKLLLQMKGLSVEKALAITEVYPTPRALINMYKICDRKQGEVLLAQLKHGDIGRCVGPVLSKAIYQLFSK